MDAAEQRLEVAPGRAVERLMGDLGLSKKALADALDATPRTLERWRARRDNLASLLEAACPIVLWQGNIDGYLLSLTT